MIRIRYRGSNELSPGLHAEAEQHGRRTTVYLLSGLTAAERRSALRRLRLTARMGHCPRLPAGQLAFALLMDRIRTGIGRAGAVLRLHPAGSTVPIMVLSGGAIAFLLFSTVSIHVLHPRAADQSDAGTSPVASASAIALGGGPQGQAAGQDGRSGSGDPRGPADPGGASRGTDTRQLTQPSGVPVTTSPVLAAGDGGAGGSAGSGGAGAGGTGSGSTGSGGSGTNSSGKSSGSSGGTTLSGSANQTSVTPRQSTPATSAPAPAPAATTPAATPSTASSGSSSGTSKGVCVNVGPLGVCLNI
jgi:hypothetical protein